MKKRYSKAWRLGALSGFVLFASACNDGIIKNLSPGIDLPTIDGTGSAASTGGSSATGGGISTGGGDPGSGGSGGTAGSEGDTAGAGGEGGTAGALSGGPL